MAFEIFAVVVFFHMPVQKTLTASVWGNITIWNGFLVLWTGQIFGQCFRSTGALNMLLNTLDQVLPSKTGKAVTLCSVVGGYLEPSMGLPLTLLLYQDWSDRVLTVFVRCWLFGLFFLERSVRKFVYCCYNKQQRYKITY